MRLPKKKNKGKYDLISISHYFPPRVGGLENMAQTLLQELSEKGIYCLAIFGSDKRFSIKRDGLQEVSFKPLNIFDDTYPIFGISFFIYLWKILVENPNAKIIVHSRHLTSSFITHIICSILQRPYTVIEHNAGGLYMSSELTTNIVNWLDRNIFVYVLLGAESIIAVSETGKRWVKKNFNIKEEKISVIYNSYDQKDTDIDIKNKKNIIVWVSKRIKVKNPQMVLRAYTYIAERHPDWLFMLIGDGPSFNYDSSQLPPNVKVVNQMLKQKDLFNLFRESKIYINSSYSEGLSMANLEAIAHANIPVLSDAPSNKEIAEEIGTGLYIFRRNNAKDLAETLHKAILKTSDIKFVKDISKKSLSKFSVANMTEQYHAMLLPEHYENENLKKISVVIPVYNEESTIVPLLEKVSELDFPKDIKKEIILVNDASKDKSKQLITSFIKKKLKDTEFILLENEKNSGKSQTVKKGILASSGDLVVVQDADLEYEPKDLIRLTKGFLEDPYLDVIYGNRFNKENTFFNSTHNWGNKLVTYLSNLFTRNRGFEPQDMETCYKMVRGDLMRSLFESLESITNFGLEPELTAKLSRYRKMNGKRLKFEQMDISYVPRTIEQGKKMRWFKHGFEALLEILYFNTTEFEVKEEYRGREIIRKF